MDSHSGPELPSKVHAFGGTVKLLGQNRGRPTPSPLWVVAALIGCSPDTHDVRGALGAAASAVGQHDERALFLALDQRARYALDAIVNARKEARTLIEASYPASEAAPALAALGDAASAARGSELFGRRCNAACMDELGQKLAAPREVHEEGRLAHVTTVRGDTLTLYKADDGSYGLVWNSDALVRERARAYAELELTKRNAKLYEEKRGLK
jgi:hypothetical protein